MGFKAASHKIYEISCKIAQSDNLSDEVIVEQGGGHVDEEDNIETSFYIKTYFGDITDESTRRPLNDMEVIPFAPNANRNDRFQFKIWSDHSDNYVHLETCSLSLADTVGRSFEREFINDGCVLSEFKPYFGNENRTSIEINEDWFNMRPIIGINSCKSTWNIDCTVASCNRDLDQESVIYQRFCKPDCDRYPWYAPAFSPARRRRSTSADQPAESHVTSNLVHPCFYVDEQNTQYCVDTTTCWSLQQCVAAFPNDFSQVQIDNEFDSELHQIMKDFEAAVQEHINNKLTENQAVVHENVMASIRDNANRVLDRKQTFDDAVEEIIRLINTL